jgi:hypothetical protein
MISEKKREAFVEDEILEPMREMISLTNVLVWIKDNLSPEDVFDDVDLETWAEENGFVKEEEEEEEE